MRGVQAYKEIAKIAIPLLLWKSQDSYEKGPLKVVSRSQGNVIMAKRKNILDTGKSGTIE